MTDTITTDLSPVPSRSAPSTFASRMDTWLGKISAWTDEANALAIGANTNKLAAEAAETTAKKWAENPEDIEVEAGQYSAKHHAVNAADSETNAAASASEAESFAQTAINAPGTSATSTTSVLIGTGSKNLVIQTGKDIVVGMFILIARTSAPENYMAGQVTSYNSETGALVVFVDSVGGSGTYTDWTVSLSAITFDAATEAEMQAGTETAIRTMSPALIAAHVNARIDYQEFTTSGTWTKPATAKYVYVEAVGGGGGGANDTSADETGGGGGGAGIQKIFRASELGATETITIGAGGNGGATGGSNNGADGGDTSFGAHLIAPGGNGNTHSSYPVMSDFGNGGGGLSLPLMISSTEYRGGGGYSCGSGSFGGGISGGNSVIGGAGGGGTNNTTIATAGGSSVYGGAGGAGSVEASTAATSGSVPGGGGGGSSNDGGGGNGADGRLRVWSW